MLSTTMAPLGQNVRWLNWVLEPGPDKPRKRTVDPRTGYYCKPNDPALWCTYDDALAAAIQRGQGVAYVFNEGDGYWFLDIDNAWDASTGEWSPVAQHLMTCWGGHAGVEVSQSGTGLHVFGRASSIPDHACRNVSLGLELYHTDRFVAFTDHQSFGAIDADTGPVLTAIINAYFPRTAKSHDVVDWTDEGDGATPDDAELLQIMLASGKRTVKAHVDATHVAFADLWDANADVLAKRWPSHNGHDAFDRSYADSALASHLVYWCGGNCARVERFMRQSALARPKWDDREDYLPRTIINAAAVTKNRAEPRKADAPLGGVTLSLSGKIEDRTGSVVLGYTLQKELFDGCVYVHSLNKAWVPHLGTLLDKPRFEIIFGGRHFVNGAEGKGSKSAWDAFTNNQGFKAPVAGGTCFRPHLPSGCVTEDCLVNTWWPVHTPRLAGDAGPFLRHLWKILPNGDDARIVMSYMARLLRNPGLKAQWWPVIQGGQGNGKTILNLVMQFAIGSRYAHQARPATLAKTGMQFNSWVTGNLYLGLEEIRVNNRRDFLDEIKDIITNTIVGTEGKGADQLTSDNYLNGMAFTNHKDAVPVEDGDRRWCVFFCAQQTALDLKRDGMDGRYFSDLYDWMNGRGAYADQGADYGLRIVNHYLREVAEIDARYDPAGDCQRAPVTTTSQEVLRHARGHVEQEIVEACEAHQSGFAGGWLSSHAVDHLLNGLRVRMTRLHREEMLGKLGYAPHPALPGGRPPRAPAGQLGAPVLYVAKGHMALNLSDGEAIVQAYERAQESRPVDVRAARG